MILGGNDLIAMVERRGYGSSSRMFVAAFAVFALALTASCGGASGEGGGQRPAGGQEAPASVDAGLGREPLGEANAPVVLIEYGDYQ